MAVALQQSDDTVQSLAAARVAAKRKAKIIAMPPTPATPTVTLNTDQLAEAIRFVRGSVLQDNLRPILGGVYLGDGYAVAADGYKLARFACPVGPIEGVIPRDSLAMFSLYHDHEITLTQEKPDLLTVEGLPDQDGGYSGARYVKLIPGSFPKVEQIINFTPTLFVTASAGPLAAIGKYAMSRDVMTDQPARQWAKVGRRVLKSVPIDPPLLRLTVAMNGELTLSTRDGADPITLKVAIDGPVEETYPPFLKKQGVRERARIEKDRAALAEARRVEHFAREPLVIGLNGHLLSTLLAPLPTGAEVRIGFTSATHPIKLSSPNVPAWQAVLMPIHLEKRSIPIPSKDTVVVYPDGRRVRVDDNGHVIGQSS